MKYCVPQGSLLGPVLFFVFINGLSYYMSKKMYALFAADTTMVSVKNDMKNVLADMSDTQSRNCHLFYCK